VQGGDRRCAGYVDRCSEALGGEVDPLPLFGNISASLPARSASTPSRTAISTFSGSSAPWVRQNSTLSFQVKQLLLRVPDELHERLARRSIPEGTSVNALATGVLDVAVTDVARDPRSIGRARASGRGFLLFITLHE